MAVDLYTVATTKVGTSLNSYLTRQSITYYEKISIHLRVSPVSVVYGPTSQSCRISSEL